MGDLRKTGRQFYNGKISLTWAMENGDACARNGECVDVSATGIKVKLDSQIPARTVVTVRARDLALHGSASVRSCNRVGARYIIGLEFVGGMRFQLPPVMTPAPGAR